MNYRVLIIEDDLAYKLYWADMLNHNLGNNTTEIQWAVSAEEAYLQYEKSISSKRPFDFIITDVFLSGPATGLDFVEDIFAEDQEAPPVILISSVDKIEVEAMIDKSFRRIEVLSKPINVSEFKEAFNHLINEKRAKNI